MTVTEHEYQIVNAPEAPQRLDAAGHNALRALMHFGESRVQTDRGKSIRDGEDVRFQQLNRGCHLRLADKPRVGMPTW